jgi:Uma2 family endonuclease
METTVVKKTWTEKELMALPNNGNKYELINGELIMGPTGIEHEDIGARLLAALERFVLEHKLGIMCGSNAGYWMKSGNLRSPDVSFISKNGEDIFTGFTLPVSELFVEL